MLVSPADVVTMAGALLQASTANKEELKDNAKEWLDKGQKWLMGAGKKLAAAAKEAQSTIQTRLEDMEVFKPSQGMSNLPSCRLINLRTSSLIDHVFYSNGFQLHEVTVLLGACM